MLTIDGIAISSCTLDQVNKTPFDTTMLMPMMELSVCLLVLVLFGSGAAMMMYVLCSTGCVAVET